MRPARVVMAAGLLSVGAGCSNLGNGLGLRTFSERMAVARADAEADRKAADRARMAEAKTEVANPEPVDLFHPSASSPTARMARYFPGLSRTFRPAPASTAEPMRGLRRDDHLPRRPRPSSSEHGEDETVTASASVSDRHTRPASARFETREADDRAPTLPIAVVAQVEVGGEGESNDRPARRVQPLPPLSPEEEELRSARMAETRGRRPGASVRRMPPVPSASQPEAGHAPTRELARARAKDEDRDTRQAEAEAEVDPSPAAGASASLDEPPSVAGPSASPIDEPPPPVAPDPQPDARPDDEPADAEPDPTDAPPPPKIDRPTAPPAGRPPTGRPKSVQLPEPRTDRPPDLPAPRFLPSYYGRGGAADDRNASAAEGPDAAARKPWTPRLLRRLLGEPIPTR